MSTDAAVRAAERSGDKEAHVRALIRAGRGKEALKVRGIVVGDRVQRVAFHGGGSSPIELREIGQYGRIGALDDFGPGAKTAGFTKSDFVYVIFDEESVLRTASGAPENEWRAAGTPRGRFGMAGKGWAVMIETLALVDLVEDLPPMTVAEVCRHHYTYNNEPCASCKRIERTVEVTIGRDASTADAGPGQTGA